MAPVAAMIAFAVAKGVPLSRITDATGLTLTDLVQPDSRVPDRIMGDLWRMMTESFPDQAIGLELAKAAPFSFFGVLKNIGGYATTLRDALESSRRYRSVLSVEARYDIDEGPELTTIRIGHVLDDVEYFGAPPEAMLGLSVRFHREILGAHEALVRIELRHPPMGPVEQYEEFFGVPVRFEQPHNAAVLRTELLDRPLRSGSRPNFSLLQGHLENLRQRILGGDAPAELARIRNAIAANAKTREFRAEALARRLGMSLRSLERLVRARGTSVRRMLDDARETRARELLADPRLGVQEVAAEVGYSAESAFRRAFKRWSGMSPAEFRRAKRNTAPARPGDYGQRPMGRAGRLPQHRSTSLDCD